MSTAVYMRMSCNVNHYLILLANPAASSDQPVSMRTCIDRYMWYHMCSPAVDRDLLLHASRRLPAEMAELITETFLHCKPIVCDACMHVC